MDSKPKHPGGRPSKDISEIICPVCGYYCLGKGGIGCIDKLGLILNLRNAKDG